MKAKEYFNKIWRFFDNHTGDGESILLSKASEQRGIDILQEYADQETERLRAELEYQKKKVETLQSCMLDTSRRLNTELTELKERHKRYAIDFANFIALKGYTLIQKNISENGATFFIDKKSIGVNSIELYEQYYKQKFESND